MTVKRGRISQLITDPANVSTHWIVPVVPLVTLHTPVTALLVDVGEYSTARIWQRKFFNTGDNVIIEKIQLVFDFQFVVGIEPTILEINAEFISGGGLIALGLNNILLPYNIPTEENDFIRYGVDIPVAPVEAWSFVLNYTTSIQNVGVPADFIGETLVTAIILTVRHTLPLTVAP